MKRLLAILLCLALCLSLFPAAAAEDEEITIVDPEALADFISSTLNSPKPAAVLLELLVVSAI